MTYAFLSYQTADKVAADHVKAILAKVRVESFLAHKDIEVSVEWRQKILEEIAKADLFICLLSKDYLQSAWCMQESGIAAFRPGFAIVPLSLDGSIPSGFISSYQSVQVNPEKITLTDLLPAFLKHDFALGIALLTDQVASSPGYRSAEQNFQLVLPHVPQMTDAQVKALLEKAAENDQVHHAGLCARDYLPPLLESHGRLLAPKTHSFLKKICERYAPAG
jgi:hypothetical protein